MTPGVRQGVEAALGARIASEAPVSGGDINEAFRVVLSDGRTVFVKSNARAPATMFEAEARGLEWLEATKILRIPRVLGAGEAFLVLEFVNPSPPSRSFDEQLGRGLAALHRFGAPWFGLDHDNFIGRLPQSNALRHTWTDFYRECRLEPQLERATGAGLATAKLRASFDRLFTRLPELTGPTEPPARLHGDLWSGNLHTDEQGAPCLVDPAVYGGHREMDLAMMRLFGGFGERTFRAYDEAFPLSPGHEERVALYQLYPLLVHVNLFGGSYVGAVERAVAGLVG